jgi:hypothetical protein
VEFEEGLERLSRVVAQAAGREASWVARLRAGLVALLGFLEDEPGWAQLLFLASPNGDARAREQRATGVLTALLNDGSPHAIGEIALAPRLAAELVAGGVFAVMRSHVHEACMGEAGALVELAPSLMAFVVLPYLGLGAAEAELLGGSPSPGEARGDMSFQACVDIGTDVFGSAANARRAGAAALRRVGVSGRAVSGGLREEGSRASFDRNREDKGVVDK